jgi:alpha-glucosidase
MINFEEKDAVLTLSYNGIKLFEHSKETPFITVGYKMLKYKSSHGSFKVMPKGKNALLALTDYIINGNNITFNNENISIKIVLEEKNEGLYFNMQSKGHFENVAFRFIAYKDECIFGGGEQYRKLNLKKEKVINFVSEHIKIKPIVEKTLLKNFKKYRIREHSEIHTYSPMSTFVSSKLYAIRIDVDSYGEQDFTKPDFSTFTYWELPRSIAIFNSDSFKGISEKLAMDIPNNEFLPDWAYDGMILGVQGGIERVMQKAIAMQDKGAEICGVWCQDWSGKKVTAAGKQVYWNWEVDNNSYKDLEQNIIKLKDKGIHFLAYINPYLIKDGEMYNYCKDKGFLIKNPKGEIYHIKSTTFDAGMMDLTNPGMVKYLKNTIIAKNMLDIGVDGYMADFGEYLPVDSVLYSGEDAKDLHNIWPYLWAKYNKEAVEESERADEIFFFTRSGYNKVQSYTSIMWNGDQHTDYTIDYGMPCVMPATFNLGFSGVTAVHSDIGGFISFSTLKRDEELFIRWMEMNAFSPLMRSHETIRPEENAQYDSENVADHCVKLTKAHNIIKPYLIDCMKEANKGIPIMRPPFYEFNDMEEYNSDYIYMLGSDILVAPVLEKGLQKNKVWLPKGEWIHIFTGKLYDEGEIEINSPLGTPSVFYKSTSKYEPVFSKIKDIK